MITLMLGHVLSRSGCTFRILLRLGHGTRNDSSLERKVIEVLRIREIWLGLIPKVSARMCTSKPFRVLTNVRTNSSQHDRSLGCAPLFSRFEGGVSTDPLQ